MSTMNRGIVQRTRGLLETNPSMQSYQYGPDFQYEEFMIAPNRVAGAMMSMAVFTLGFCLSASSSVCHLFLADSFCQRALADSIFIQAFCC